MAKVAFLFPGQGSQYVGMGKELYKEYSICRDIFELSNNVLGYDLSKLCFEGPKEELDNTEVTQLAVLTVSLAASGALKVHNIIPQAVAGLSLGEYTALALSGAFELKGALELVAKRSKYMQEAVPKEVGKMAAIVGLDDQQIQNICNEVSNFGSVWISNYNCPGQRVIAGEREGVDQACIKAKECGARAVMPLAVSIPAHTKMLEPAAQRLKNELDNMEICDLNIPVVSNVTGDHIKNKNDINDLLTRHVVSPVLWEKSINTLLNDGFDTFIEVGPGKVLSGFVKKINKDCKILNVEDINTLENTVKELGG